MGERIQRLEEVRRGQTDVRERDIQVQDTIKTLHEAVYRTYTYTYTSHNSSPPKGGIKKKIDF